MITDGGGIPLAVFLTGGHVGDVTRFLPLVHAIPPIRGKRGRSRCRPDTVFADRAYDSAEHDRALRRLGITPVVARRGAAHGSGLGTVRWVVERSNSWLHQFRRLRIRWERRADIHEAFLSLACALICYRRLHSF